MIRYWWRHAEIWVVINLCPAGWTGFGRCTVDSPRENSFGIIYLGPITVGWDFPRKEDWVDGSNV
jgi:hypothetical protein